MTDENIGSIAQSEREKHGYDIWARRTVQRILEVEQSKIGLVIIDGIRGDAEVEVFKEYFGTDFRTVAILIPKKKRFEFLQKRGRSDAPMTLADFKARDLRETKWGITRAIEQADYIIMNTGTLEELELNFKELILIIQAQK